MKKIFIIPILFLLTSCGVTPVEPNSSVVTPVSSGANVQTGSSITQKELNNNFSCSGIIEGVIQDNSGALFARLRGEVPDKNQDSKYKDIIGKSLSNMDDTIVDILSDPIEIEGKEAVQIRKSSDNSVMYVYPESLEPVSVFPGYLQSIIATGSFQGQKVMWILLTDPNGKQEEDIMHGMTKLVSVDTLQNVYLQIKNGEKSFFIGQINPDEGDIQLGGHTVRKVLARGESIESAIYVDTTTLEPIKTVTHNKVIGHNICSIQFQGKDLWQILTPDWEVLFIDPTTLIEETIVLPDTNESISSIEGSIEVLNGYKLSIVSLKDSNEKWYVDPYTLKQIRPYIAPEKTGNDLLPENFSDL